MGVPKGREAGRRRWGEHEVQALGVLFTAGPNLGQKIQVTVPAHHGCADGGVSSTVRGELPASEEASPA